MANTTLFIKRHIAKLQEGQMFSTRDLLGYGSRGAVDRCVGRLIDKQFIVRAARGIFVKTVEYQAEKTPLPSIEEIARFKARVYKKDVLSPGKQIGEDTFEFKCSGRNSAFDTVHGRVILRQISQRKISLGNSSVGTKMLELWALGRHEVDEGSARLATIRFGREERREMKSLTDVLPCWLSAALRLPREERPRAG